MKLALAFWLICGLAGPAFAVDLASSDRLASAIADATIYEQRKDVREISIPPLPTGPANPAPGCSPATPYC